MSKQGGGYIHGFASSCMYGRYLFSCGFFSSVFDVDNAHVNVKNLQSVCNLRPLVFRISETWR